MVSKITPFFKKINLQQQPSFHLPLRNKNHGREWSKNGSELGLTYLVHQMGIVLQELQDIILDAFHDIGDSRFAKTGLPEKTDRNDREKKGTGSHDSSKGSDSNLPENKTLM